MDRSCSGRLLRRAPLRTDAFDHRDRVLAQFQLVQQECRFYFIGRHNRSVIFSTQAPTLDDAIQKFRASGHPDSDTLFIIKTETQIFLA